MLNVLGNNPFEFLRKLLHFAWKYFIVFLMYLSPIREYLYCVYILLFIDLFTGIYKSLKTSVPITSKRLRDTIVKYVFYSVAIYVGFEIDVKILKTVNDFYLSRLIGGTIALTEFYSVLENISVITGTDILSIIRDKVSQYINGKLKLPDEIELQPKEEQK